MPSREFRELYVRRQTDVSDSASRNELYTLLT